ncbi:transcriptional regulator family: Fungal Specific TF [Penicillium riverlandense]|uniref:transcriptional regulator family: Fungal Specific TF n=1 Tax=Penicillium riverlandense TaxID=1903569 RepID=UPI002549AD9D|nr:transcriptional regulator family: Fungal Specific TF [Penicillium riverlandense]KAJ5819406.1 transcriptional regulator family: Fungal Specific TF [Penicillium riverlandense]
MYALIAAGSEVEREDDHNWVLDRWITIQSRLMLGSADRSLQVLREVWNCRDAIKGDRQQHNIGNNNRASSLSNDDRNKIKTTQRPVEPQFSSSSARHEISLRGSAIAPLEKIEVERTVRGRLHWVNVMAEWGWEMFIG